SYPTAVILRTSIDEILPISTLSSPDELSLRQVILIPGVPPPDVPSPKVVPRNLAGAGFKFPSEGACLPNVDKLMPNAPREYRAGIHEGVDFYAGYNCANVAEGTPVTAAKAGTDVRADHGFTEFTADELQELLNSSLAQGYTDAAALDRFRGRQDWVDHGKRVGTRYCHLSEIPPAV